MPNALIAARTKFPTDILENFVVDLIRASNGELFLSCEYCVDARDKLAECAHCGLV